MRINPKRRLRKQAIRAAKLELGHRLSYDEQSLIDEFPEVRQTWIRLGRLSLTQVRRLWREQLEQQKAQAVAA